MGPTNVRRMPRLAVQHDDLSDSKDAVPFIPHLVSDGLWLAAGSF